MRLSSLGRVSCRAPVQKHAYSRTAAAVPPPAMRAGGLWGAEISSRTPGRAAA